MYEVHLQSCDDKLLKFGVSTNRAFHFEFAADVCDLIKSLPPKVFVSLVEFDYDSVEDVLKLLSDGSENL